MACLNIIIGVHALNGWHDYPSPKLGAGLVSISLAYAVFVMVCHNNNILSFAVHLTQTGGYGNQATGAVSNHTWPTGSFVNGGSGGKALSNVKRAGFI